MARGRDESQSGGRKSETFNIQLPTSNERPARSGLESFTEENEVNEGMERKRRHPASSLLCYCDAGIARFIVGDYAWAMTEALMVGYNTVHAKPSTALTEPFGKRTKEIGSVGKPRDCRFSPHQPPVAITRHKRSFPLRGRRAQAITLRHLWLATPISL